MPDLFMNERIRRVLAIATKMGNTGLIDHDQFIVPADDGRELRRANADLDALLEQRDREEQERWEDQPEPKYIPSNEELARIANAFTYHKPKDDQQERYEALRAEARSMAALFVHNCPPSRELSLALRALEEAIMWANASIARNE